MNDTITHRPSGRGTRVLGTLAALAGVFILAWGGLALAAHRAGPYLRERILRDLNQRFDGGAELGPINVTVFPQLRIDGERLILRQPNDPSAQPFISIQHFSAEGNPLGLLTHRISRVHLTGLSIVLPPHRERPKLDGSSSGGHESPGHQTKTSFVIGTIVSDDAHLELLTDKPGKIPLSFDIRNLVMHSAGPGKAMPFTATLTNPKPIGDIAAKGEFGPWDAPDPRDTPVSGSYSFTNADLGSIHGIGGILSSRGRFNGVLGQIQVHGATDTPDFQVSTGKHPMPLHTDFDATVDGATGDTYLHPVNAKLAGSEIVANGSVVKEKDGHRVTLDVTAGKARIEDLLRVAVDTNPPTLSGPVSLHTSFVLLPDQGEPVPRRLKLDGSFSVKEAKFLQPKVQEKLDSLSARAEGKPKEAEQHDAPEVLSNLQGQFKLDSGTISLSRLTFEVPGAEIDLTGQYQLIGRQFSFDGHARLKAELSQMTTGVKSFFLKALDPIFSKQGAGTVIPIRISGTGTSPKVSLDFGKPRRGSNKPGTPNSAATKRGF